MAANIPPTATTTKVPPITITDGTSDNTQGPTSPVSGVFLPPNKTLGIRREDKSRWERRTPLAPSHVHELVKRGVKVYVQPSNLRVFSDDEYTEAGAIVQEDLSPASTIIAVKEVPPAKLLANRTYMFFSHTIKAQPTNMAMLDTILEKNIRLIDYEKIVDKKGARIVRFGKFAGFAGMIDMLRILGERLLSLGYSTPFLNIGYAHMYSRLEDAKRAVQAVGEEIQRVGLPRALSPMIFVFTGATGNVASGAWEIFKLLPNTVIEPEELKSFAGKSSMKWSGSWSSLNELVVKSEDLEKRRYTLFAVNLNAEDYIEPNDPNKTFSKAEYYAHPEQYHSLFHEKFAPYMSVMVNCAYWDQKYPRLITVNQIRELNKQKKNRLIGIADLSCDINGGVEFMYKTTSIDRPIFLYDVETGAIHDSYEGRGVIILGVDNLPTELPYEASLYFGDSLLPFIEKITASDGRLPYEKQTDLPAEIYSAVITSHKKLVPKYEYITELRHQYEKGIHKVLLLGSGAVAPPVVDYILRDSAYILTIASAEIETARELARGYSTHAAAARLDVNDAKALETMISKHELVISLVPATFHVKIAKICIAHKKNMVTASYISPEMKALDDSAKEAGIIILNEVGLDPGLDHMSSLNIIDDVNKKGGKITSFTSVCGGLPAPESANNPLGYKFSWNPKGVLTAGLNSAKYRKDGKIVEVPGSELYFSVTTIDVEPCFRMEMLPNRDSTIYARAYGLDNIDTFMRGTLRYRGYSMIMGALSKIGLFDSTVRILLQESSPAISWPQLLSKLLPNPDIKELRTRILKVLQLDSSSDKSKANKILGGLEWLGFFDEYNMVAMKGTCIDCLCALLQERLTFKKGERDLVLLQHQFKIEWHDCTEFRTSTLIAYGEDEGYTAMAKTVGVPTAIATKLILTGQITAKGVLAPFLPSIYKPILQMCEEEGILFQESSVYESLASPVSASRLTKE